MVQDYLDWFLTFIVDAIAFLGSCMIVTGVSLLHFIIAVAILCIVIGGILIR